MLEVIAKKASASVAPSVCVAVSGIVGIFLGIAAAAKRGKVGGSPDYGLLHRDRGNAVLLAGAGAAASLYSAASHLPQSGSVSRWNGGGRGQPGGSPVSRISAGVYAGTDRISSIAMHTREKVIEILESDYVLYARARGESGWRLIFRHGLRNLLLPVITLQFGLDQRDFRRFGAGGTGLSYPGLGQAAVTAGLGSDIPLLLGITLISAVLVFAGNAAADGLYRLVDPET